MVYAMINAKRVRRPSETGAFPVAQEHYHDCRPLDPLPEVQAVAARLCGGPTLQELREGAVSGRVDDPRFLLDNGTIEKGNGKRRPRNGHMTKAQRREAQARFLESFRITGNTTTAAAAAGLGRSTVYVFLEEDEEFSFAYHQAEAEATEHLEAEARRRAVEGTVRHKPLMYMGEVVAEEVIREYSDTLLIFLLKGRAPEKYRERFEHTGAGGGPILTMAAVDKVLEDANSDS